MEKTKEFMCNWKCMAAICTVLVAVTLVDVKFSMDKKRDLVFSEVKNWTFIYGESVRIALNNLMREGKMSSRFDLLNSMEEELVGLKSIRVIRGRKVDEIFRRVAEEEVVPREKQAIETMEAEIAEFEVQLKATTDEDERSDLRDEITVLNEDIESANFHIAAALADRPIDERELPRDQLERDVLGKGEPLYQFKDDHARILIPYLAKKKGCAEASGCHRYAKEGDVLGAVSMEFSIAEMNARIKTDSIESAAFEAIKLGIVFAFILFYVVYTFRYNLARPNCSTG